MQETRYQDRIEQKIFSAETAQELRAAMNAAIRPGEQLIRQVPLDTPSVKGINRHQRRMEAALARRHK